MTPFLLLLSLQFPAAQDPQVGAPRALDIVDLKNGDHLEGRITQQLDGYVEILLEAGATVGVSIAQVAAIRRGAGVANPAAEAALAARNEWFVLHDGQGVSVGWMHASVVLGKDGAPTITEEYEFADGRRRYQVTSLCTADAQLQPRTCYFRERISEPILAIAVLPGMDASGQSDRIVDERIVEATCRDADLLVVRLDRSGRKERTLGWTPATTFPLLARAVAQKRGAAAQGVAMFDPATEELVVRSFEAARQRRILWEGKALDVTEFAESSTGGRNSEWLDASSRTLRRELAGPTLVAVPSNADSARTMGGGAPIASSLAREVEGAFGLWIPNPAWQVVAELPPGQVALSCEAHGASIGLTRLDHLEPGTPLDTAVDAVASWFRLLHPELRVERREAVVVRERPAVRLWAGGRSAGAPVQATVDVIPHRGHFLVLVCRAPVASWEELAADFGFLLRSIELEPQSMAPTLQGPVAAREERKAKREGRAKGAEVKIPEVKIPVAPPPQEPEPTKRKPVVKVAKDS